MKLLREPNPVWMREMRQAARLTRTPVVLATVTSSAALLVSAIGGAASSATLPAEVGTVLYHTFFSIAFAVVCWVGPGVAALTIASERSAKTWEALVLTGLSPRVIARGKFAAALTYIGLFLVALAPVGALPFLFGGVTATEVLAAFGLLWVFAALAVGFGLSVSSATASPAVALLVTLPSAVGVSIVTYTALGFGLSFAAHERWPGVSEGLPAWLPTAYVRADFGLPYVVYLVLAPLVIALVLASFFYEVTTANLADPNDDRSSALKRWFSLASLAVTLVALLPPLAVSSEPWIPTVLGLGASGLVSALALFVLAGDAESPSRRVLAAWERTRASALARFLGPGIDRTMLFLSLVTAVSQTVIAIEGVVLDERHPSGSDHGGALLAVAGYGIAFYAFLAGFVTFARTRTRARATTRVLLVFVLFAAFAGPWLVLAIAGVSSGSFDKTLALAAPSPLYVFVVLGEATSYDAPATLRNAALAVLFWLAAGALSGAIGARRLARARSEECARTATLEAELRLEDEAERARREDEATIREVVV